MTINVYESPQVPEQPDEGTVVLDGKGVAWQRRESLWFQCGAMISLFGTDPHAARAPWAELWFRHGPLTRMVVAVPGADPYRSELIALRNELIYALDIVDPDTSDEVIVRTVSDLAFRMQGLDK